MFFKIVSNGNTDINMKIAASEIKWKDSNA